MMSTAQEGHTQDSTAGTLLTSAALYDLNAVAKLDTKPKIMTEIIVHYHSLKFEVDSGAASTLMSEDTYQATYTEDVPSLQRDDVKLRTWSARSFALLGCANLEVY